MARIFISFLGIGTYTEVSYRLDGVAASTSKFAQCAELELLGPETFDRVILLKTAESEETHGSAIRQQLGEVLRPGALQERTISSDIADLSQQWRWFEAVLEMVGVGDDVVIDMTHGFRAVPILLSSALGYLQKTKDIRVEHVFYAEVKTGTIVEMRDFYVVQEWAEAVGRLLDNADAGMLAELATRAPAGSSFARLADPAVGVAFKQLTDALRNVDVHNIGAATRAALAVVEAKRADKAVTDSEAHLLSMVAEKFTRLAVQEPESGRYSAEYLRLQIEVSRVLLEHNLLMQAFTVMRECIGSIGMYGLRGTKKDIPMGNAKGRSERPHADIFVNMLQYAEDRWTFEGQGDAVRGKFERLLPWYRGLVSSDREALRRIVKEVVDTRNGFDHGWTMRAFPVAASDAGERAASSNIAVRGRELLEALSGVVERLPNPAGSHS
jgi:CRISPR-associated Csx2 family protein